MHKFLTKLLIVIAALGIASTAGAQSVAPQKGVVRVKLQAEAAQNVGKAPRKIASGRLATGAVPLDEAAVQIKATSIRPMLPPNPKFAAERARYGLDRWYVVEFDENVPVDKARKILSGTPGVELSAAVLPVDITEGKGKFVVTKSVPRKAPGIDYVFNDPQLPAQWHYKNFGNIGTSVAGADINLFDAWATETGSKNVVVAIIDGGVDYRHEDLAANMCVNEAELNGLPGVDDDGNGYVDDIYGYNFCTNSGEIYPHSHGTHVAGTVAAVNNNGIGVAGVAGGDGTPGSGVKMISCQVFDSRQGAPEGDFAAAIVYAAERGATIAQCSWGWSEAEYFDPAVKDAIDYFTSTARSSNMTGGLCIFATGNNGQTGNFYPAAYDKVLAVTAMTSELRPASYSNYGAWADVIAPGGLLDYGDAYGVLSTLPNNEYGYNEGTSMATPHVSGIAALILSKYGSPSFVSSTLRTQLETSVNDFYGYADNARYTGLYGSGYIDAAKALSMGDGSAPDAVTDFTLDAAQDYLALSWTIPSSADNNVNHHIVYYSETPFTATTLDGVSSLVADTRFLSSGETFSFEIPGLKPLTKYYVAIAAVNRWGNASALSPVKTATTNAGPKMTVDCDQLSLLSDATNPVAHAALNIGNEAEGILKWQSYKRTAPVSAFSNARPVIGRTKAWSGRVDGKKITPHSVVTGDYEASEYPTEIRNYSELWAYIGDTDRTKPNSMAQWFRVEADKYPEGFNLTHINIDGANGKDPVIEIYRGDVAVSSATLLQRISYNFFVYNFPIALNEQLFFRPGESFWVVVHFEGNQEGYPLGMAAATDATKPAASFMSDDMGKTWTQLSESLRGSAYESNADKMTWAITARSTNPDWSEVLVLDPASGTVRQGETQVVDLSADGSKMVNGKYKLNLHLTSNQTEDNDLTVPVSLEVTGNKPMVQMPKIVNFGSLLVGESKTLTVEAYNAGFGSFSGSEWSPGLYEDNIVSSSPNFKGPDYLQSGFPARSRTTFEITYAPAEAGSHTGYITFTDMNGNEARVVVQGVATEPAHLTLEPAVTDAGTLTVGNEATQATFRIGNSGKYPLEYVFPRFSDETVEGNTAKQHKFGYTVSANLPGYSEHSYDGNPALIGGTDIASQFTDNDVLSKPVSIGFAFPYYGKTYEKVYITSFGGLMFAPNELILRTPLTPTEASIAGTGFIAAYGQQLSMGPQSKVEYAKADGKFVVKFTDVLATVYDQEYTPISFHLTLSSNGDIEIYYDDYNPYAVFSEGYGLFCGINDPACADPVTVTSADQADIWGENPTPESQRFREFASGTAVRFSAPKPFFVKDLDKAHGIVSPGETVEVTATLQADESMYAGASFNNLTIVTNDPAPEYSFVRFEAVIDGESLKPVASLENTTIALGDVFRTSEQNVAVTVKNNGNREFTVTGVTVEGQSLSHETEVPFILEAGMAKDIIVKVNTDTEGAVSGKVTVTTTAGDLTAEISATVIGCPALSLSFDSVEETIESGTPLVKDLTVTNNGNETLRYAITPDALVRMTLPQNAESTTSYTYSFSGDNPTVGFDWIDIETNGLGEHRDMSYYMLHDYVAVDLPFEFPFYGKKYTRMYIYNTGFVSFTERKDDRLWPEPPAEFPQGSIFTNIIAPYWGMHSMDQTRTAGTYYHADNDRAVVSFTEYGNSMNIGVDFQLILDRDGSFRFQYKGAYPDAIIYSPFGLAGICNEDGSSSIRLPERMLMFDRAVAFSPVVEDVLKPGESETIVLDFDTKRMAGLYETTLAISSNVPGLANTGIPVSLEITGKAAPVWPADQAVENVIGHRSTDYSDPLVQLGAMYNVPFKVLNQGTAAFTITDITVDSPMIVDEWFGYEMPAFTLFVYADELDWMTGEPTGNKIWTQHEPGWSTYTVGSEGLELALPMMENEFAYTPGVYEVPITFSYETEEGAGEKSMKVTFTVTPAPAMTMDREEIRVKATSETDVFAETLRLGNEGEYKLRYSVTLDPSGVGEEIEEPGGGIAPWAKIKARTEAARSDTAHVAPVRAKAPADRNANDVPTDFDFRNALYYPAVNISNVSVYNYGANTVYDQFKAATVFTAPADGFNVSHIYLPVTIETATNYTLTVKVVSGDIPGEGDVLSQGKLTIASQDDPRSGRFYIVPLERSVYLNGGENFHVEVSCPAGVKAPLYLISKQDATVENRYMAWMDQYGWYDAAALFEENYGSLGYIMTCLETVEGRPWIRLLSEETEGIVETGSTAEVKVEINAAAARLEKNNKAVLVIKSNDPALPLHNFEIYLDKNGRPVIEAPANTVYAKEGAVTELSIAVSDPDADDFTIAFSDAKGIAKVSAVDAGEATVTPGEEGTYAVAGAEGPVDLKVEIRPEYGTASTGNAFDVTVTDKHGLAAEASVAYTIEHVNRAPAAVENIPEVSLYEGATSAVVSFAELFIDPDGDDLSYTFSIDANNVAEAYPNATGVIFFGKKTGKTTAKVTATDPSGASATLTLPVEVKETSGIDAAGTADGEVRVTPNPVDGDINVYCGFDADEALFVLFDAAGRTLISAEAPVSAGTATVLPGASLPRGIYILTVTADGTTHTARVVKR